MAVGASYVALVMASCSLTVLAPMTAGGVGEASSPARDAEGWNADTGWLPLPAVPSAPPAEAWRIELRGEASYEVRPGFLITAEASKGVTTVRRVDVASGRDDWRVTIPGDALVDLIVDAEGSVVVVALEVAARGRTATTLLDAVEGRVIWKLRARQTPVSLQTHASLAIIGFDTGSLAVDVATTRVKWRTAIALITANPDSLLFHRASSAGGANETFGLLDPATGAPRWIRERPSGAIATALGEVVILSHDEQGSNDSLVGHDGATGEPLWGAQASLIGSSGAWPLEPDGALFGGNSDPDLPGSLVAIDTSAGSPRWNRSYHKPGGLAMWRSGGQQVLLTRAADGTIELVDAGSGTTAASSDAVPSGWPVFASGSLYFAGDGDVTAIDMVTLRQLWSVDTPDGSSVAGAVDGGFVTFDERGSVLTAFLG
jgi:outer membrane protein assembly factor BamB